jgi:anti-sigma-K factor RskA
MRPLTLDELRELAPGFVMGTLSLEEQRAFDNALASKAIAAELQEEIDAHRAAAEFLAMSHEVAPPPALKGRVMARISGIADNVADIAPPARASGPTRTTSAPPAAPVDERATVPLTAGTSAPSAPPEQVTAIVPAKARTSRAAWWSAGVLGAVLAASLLLVFDLRQETTTLRRQLAEQTTALTGAQGTLAERERTLATLLGGGGDVTLVRLAPSQPQGPGMQIFWNVREGKAIVSASGLSPIRRDRAYALWMIRDGKPVPIALFTPDSAGRAIVQNIAVPTALQGVAAFAVTEEPAAGSPQPTMTPFLVGAVPRS